LREHALRQPKESVRLTRLGDPRTLPVSEVTLRVARRRLCVPLHDDDVVPASAKKQRARQPTKPRADNHQTRHDDLPADQTNDLHAQTHDAPPDLR
jgi:hypothetical protein